jgi:hypothetical protein
LFSTISFKFHTSSITLGNIFTFPPPIIPSLIVFISSPTTPHKPLHLLPNLSSSTFDITSPELKIETKNNNNKLNEIKKQRQREEEQLRKKGIKQEKETLCCKDVIARLIYSKIRKLTANEAMAIVQQQWAPEYR